MSGEMVYSFHDKIEARKEEREGKNVPWKEKTVEETREEFARRCLAKEKSKSALCREYRISRPTGDKWIRRYQSGEGLDNRSRAPFKHPNKTAETTEAKILAIRRKYPAIGAVKLKRMLENRGEKELPCNSTVNAILKRNGCISPEASKAATPCQRFEKAQPNEMWQTDFKGDFLLADGARCFPLCVLDDCSRFNLCIDAKTNQRRETVVESFKRIFNEYGLPKILLCDNGNPWGTAQSSGITLFEVWLMDLGILTVHGRIRHPQTQGKEEKFNGNLNRELLKQVKLQNMADAQSKFDGYRDFYNNERPHHALNLEVPAQRYQKSFKRIPPQISEWEYEPEYEVRTIKKTGFLTYKGQGYFLSESLGGLNIGIKESSLQGCVNLYYRNFRIGRLNVSDRAVVSRRIYLSEDDPRCEPRV